MDLDRDHKLPTPEYMAATRMSIDEFVKPRLSKLDHMITDQIKIKKDDADFEKGLSALGVQRGKYIKDPNAPDDKGYFVLIIVGLYGLVHMLPHLFFSTANEYWMYKFRNTTSDSLDANDRTDMQRYFSSLTTLVVTTPGVICHFIAAIAGHKIRATTRIFFVLFMHSSILLVQAVFVSINTDSWQLEFFIITMSTKLIMSCAVSLGGSGSMGLVSRLPPQYMKAKLLGEGGSGVFSAALRLIFILVTPTVTGAALMYFITGSALMIIMSVLFYFSTKTKFFRYYTQSAKQDTKQSMRNHKDLMEVFKALWPLLFLSLFSMLVPVAAITNLVVSEYNGTDNVWGTKYFVTVCTYLIPAIAGLFGRWLFNLIDIDVSIPTLYSMYIARELVFGTLLPLCNAKPRHNLPVIVKHDWQYALVNSGHSMAHGFMMNLLMMKSMRMSPPNRIELGMMITMFFHSVFTAATSPLGVLVVTFL